MPDLTWGVFIAPLAGAGCVELLARGYEVPALPGFR